MASTPAFKATAIRTSLEVCLGKFEKPVGKLIYVKDGPREFSQFAYNEEWLADPTNIDVSPDLNRQSGYQLRKPPTKNDSCFFLALADTEPDAWATCDRKSSRKSSCKRRLIGASN